MSLFFRSFSIAGLTALCLLLGTQASAESALEAAERSGSVVSGVDSFTPIEPGETRTVAWSIITYVDIDSEVVIKLPDGRQVRVDGRRVSQEDASYYVGDQRSQRYAFRAEVSIPADATTGVATVGFRVSRRGDLSSPGMYALIPEPVGREVASEAAKQFNWNIRSSSASATWPLPQYTSFYNVNVGEFNSPYGHHKGLDVFTAPRAEVRAICDGEVVRDVTSDSARPDVWNKLLTIRHDNCNGQTVYGYYAHIESSVSGRVQAGEKIGEVVSWPGNVGNTHIHYGLNPQRIDNMWGYGTQASVSNEGWIDPRVFHNKYQ